MKLVNKFHKKWSVQLTSLASLICLLAPYLPQLKMLLPDNWYQGMFILIGVVGAIQQKNLLPGDQNDKQS
jgi:hypothetical protein